MKKNDNIIRLFAVVMMLLVGFLSIIIGIMADKEGSKDLFLFYTIISVGGGALFGSSLTMLIEYLMGNEITDIRNYLYKNEKFESAPDFIKVVSGLWHVYYLTMSNSDEIWKYVVYNVISEDHGNSIRGYFNVIDTKNQERKYRIEAGLRGSSMILMSKPEQGNEFVSVEVVPKIINTHLSVHPGIGFLETWNGDIAISYYLYSRQKLVENDSLSNNDFSELYKILNQSLINQKIICLGLDNLKK